MASLADAFLSQFPKGVNPTVEILRAFQGMQEKHAESEKQKKQAQQTQQSPQPPQGAMGGQFGQNLPPAVGNQQSPFNIGGRALGGTMNDIRSLVVGGMQQGAKSNPLIQAGQLPDKINQILQNPNVRETMGSIAGVGPDSFIPVNIDKQKDAKEVGAPVEDVATVPPQGHKEKEAGTSKFFNFFKDLGIPLITAGIGMGVPGALAGAAGFQKGYVEQIIESTDDEGEQHLT